MKNINKCRDRVSLCLDKRKGQPQWLSLQYLTIFFIKIYQNTFGFVFPQACRFYPTCSEYSIHALEKYGFFKGGWLSVRRLLRCHPFNPGGYDPVK